MLERSWRPVSAISPLRDMYAVVLRTPNGHTLRLKAGAMSGAWHLFTNGEAKIGETSAGHHGDAEPPLGWANRRLAQHFARSR